MWTSQFDCTAFLSDLSAPSLQWHSHMSGSTDPVVCSVPAGVRLGGLALLTAVFSCGNLSWALGHTSQAQVTILSFLLWPFPCHFPAGCDVPAQVLGSTLAVLGRAGWVGSLSRPWGPGGCAGWVLCCLGYNCTAAASHLPCMLMVLNELSSKQMVAGMGTWVPWHFVYRNPKESQVPAQLCRAVDAALSKIYKDLVPAPLVFSGR